VSGCEKRTDVGGKAQLSHASPPSSGTLRHQHPLAWGTGRLAQVEVTVAVDDQLAAFVKPDARLARKRQVRCEAHRRTFPRRVHADAGAAEADDAGSRLGLPQDARAGARRLSEHAGSRALSMDPNPGRADAQDARSAAGVVSQHPGSLL